MEKAKNVKNYITKKEVGRLGKRSLIIYDDDKPAISPCIYYGKNYERNDVINPISSFENDLRNFGKDSIYFIENESIKNNDFNKDANLSIILQDESCLFDQKKKFMVMSSLITLINEIKAHVMNILTPEESELFIRKMVETDHDLNLFNPESIFIIVIDHNTIKLYEIANLLFQFRHNKNEHKSIRYLSNFIMRLSNIAFSELYMYFSSKLMSSLIDITTEEKINIIISNISIPISKYRDILEEIQAQLFIDYTYSEELKERLCTIYFPFNKK